MIKRILLTLLFAVAMVTAHGQASDYDYKILHRADTTVKAKLGSISFGSRDVRFYVYEYPSTDPDGRPVTISGIIMAPSAIVDGSEPCDGVIMFNHATIGSPSQAPSQGGLDVPSAVLANPLRPNYIIVMSDYIGYGSSIDHPVAYLSGDTNARNALDGLLAARQLFADENIPQGKYLFNMGYSQGGTESMYAAKLCDTDAKYKSIRFSKTFAGGGMLDPEKAYEEFVRRDECAAINDVAMFFISVNEHLHLGISYSDLFQEPVASNVAKVIKSKDKDDLGTSGIDSLHQLLQPAYMDLKSEPAKAMREALRTINVTNGWTPDITKQYYLEHSRHDHFVPVQCGRSIIQWMKKQGFKPSLVPGKTSLQTNMMVFKLNHQQSGIVWAIQTLAAVQFWPVVYYEGEQNRYYHDVVHDLNLIKTIKYLESWGIDLRKMISESNSRSFAGDLSAAVSDGSLQPEGSVRQLSAMRRANLIDVIMKISDTLAKVNLTISDFYEMLDDSGIAITDILEAYNYLTSSASRGIDAPSLLDGQAAAPVYLLRLYEQTLADWFKLAGHDVEYESWGW